VRNQDPHNYGRYSRAELRAYYRKQNRTMFIVGAICIAVGLVALAVFFMRGGL